jgi:hypothetical protein
MSFARVKVSGWAFGEKLTSAQMNQLDIDHSTSVDAATLDLGGTTSTIVRIARETPTFDDPANWVTGANSAIDGYFVTGSPTEQACWWPVDLPHGATLTAVRLVVQGGAGHAALPSTMPQFRIRSVTNGGVAADEVSPVADSSADATAFELVHTIEVTGLSVVISNTTKRYTLVFTAESTADGEAAFKVFHPYFDFTMTNLDFQ